MDILLYAEKKTRRDVGHKFPINDAFNSSSVTFIPRDFACQLLVHYSLQLEDNAKVNVKVLKQLTLRNDVIRISISRLNLEDCLLSFRTTRSLREHIELTTDSHVFDGTVDRTLCHTRWLNVTLVLAGVYAGRWKIVEDTPKLNTAKYE